MHKNLKEKKTNNFAFIYDVEIIHSKLGIITMEVLAPLNQNIPEEWIDATEKEAKRLGIDPEELDFVGDNVMQHPKSGKLKMIDV